VSPGLFGTIFLDTKVQLVLRILDPKKVCGVCEVGTVHDDWKFSLKFGGHQLPLVASLTATTNVPARDRGPWATTTKSQSAGRNVDAENEKNSRVRQYVFALFFDR
jgi:hypothetical protein